MEESLSLGTMSGTQVRSASVVLSNEMLICSIGADALHSATDVAFATHRRTYDRRRRKATRVDLLQQTRRLADVSLAQFSPARPQLMTTRHCSVLRAMNRIGWAYASYAKPAPWLRSIIARIDSKQRQYIDASNPDPSLPWTPSSSNFDFLPTPSDDYTGVASPWGCEGDQFDIPVSSDEDWEALLQSIVGSGVTSEFAGSETEVKQDEEVLVGMLQNLLT